MAKVGKYGEDIKVTAVDLFANQKESVCQIQSCSIKDSGCAQPYSSDEIQISGTYPFDITFKKTIPKGQKSKDFCVECKTIHQTIAKDSLSMEQEPSECLNSLTAKMNQVTKEYESTKKVASLKTEIFENTKKPECDINKCELLQIGC